MTALREKIEAQLREQVCSVCFARLRNGGCGLPEGFRCPLFEHLDEVIQIVGSTQEEAIEPYVDRLRQVICSHCQMNDSGHCAKRDNLECALDMYLPLVVEIIESELKRGA